MKKNIRIQVILYVHKKRRLKILNYWKSKGYNIHYLGLENRPHIIRDHVSFYLELGSPYKKVEITKTINIISNQ